MPTGRRAAVEFRHESWLADYAYAVLRRHDSALCVADSEEFETPLVATAGWGYLRLRREGYDKRALRRWATRLKATGFDYGYTSREAVIRLGEHMRLQPILRGRAGDEGYRYEREVEEFLRWSPHVRRDREPSGVAADNEPLGI